MSKSSNTFYGMGMIGALVYNIQYAQGVQEMLWGIVKSIFWPAFFVYDILSWLPL